MEKIFNRWLKSDLDSALNALKNGGIILYPTDTIWGIGGDATQPGVVDRILELKGRPIQKSMLVLLGQSVDIKNWIGGSPQIIESGLKIMCESKEATTVIFPLAKNLATNLISADGSIGIRIPDEPFCQALLKEFGKPLISTSANLSGEPSPGIYSEISQEIIDGVDYIVGWRQDDLTLRAPSRIQRITGEGGVEVIR